MDHNKHFLLKKMVSLRIVGQNLDLSSDCKKKKKNQDSHFHHNHVVIWVILYKMCYTKCKTQKNIKSICVCVPKLNNYIWKCLDVYSTFQEEKLDGENRYFCESCQSKQSATRRIKLHSLPPTLNLQLMRFVFDRSAITLYCIV